MPSEAGICQKRKRTLLCKDRISALPDDLLLHILCLVPTKDAVTTMILSKRWGFVWTMLPRLEYTESYRGEQSNPEKSVWDFLDKSLQLHKAPSLEILRIKLGQLCPIDVDLGKWVLYAVDRLIKELSLEIRFIQTADPTSLPKSLYTCKRLVTLTLAGKILVDVPTLPCLPCLKSMNLVSVMYKDEDSHVRLLSSCPVLKYLFVFRKNPDNMTKFSVKVTSLKKLMYLDLQVQVHGNDNAMEPIPGRSLVIDSPGLSHVVILDPLGDYLSIQNMPSIESANVNVGFFFGSHSNDKFLSSFASVKYLCLWLNEVRCCSAINFSRLIELKLFIVSSVYWLEPLILLLHNAPKLKVLILNSNATDLPLSWSQPSYVPRCLLSQLEIFEWEEFGGRREEKQLVAYILSNSKCLKTAGISPRSSYNDEEKQKIMEDLESMYRVSASSQLLFTAEMRRRYC